MSIVLTGQTLNTHTPMVDCVQKWNMQEMALDKRCKSRKLTLNKQTNTPHTHMHTIKIN